MATSAAGWEAVLAPAVHWKRCYPAVTEIVRAELSAWKGDPLYASELVERLWPAVDCVSDARRRMRQRLFKALRAVAEHDLRDWCRLTGETHLYMGRRIEVWKWFDPNRSPTGATVRDKQKALADAALACVGEIRRWREAAEADVARFGPALEVTSSVQARLEKALAL